MTDRIQAFTIETSTVPIIRTQLIGMETTSVPIRRKQLIEIESARPFLDTVEIAESIESDIFFDPAELVEIAESISSTIVFPQTFTIVGDVEIAERACSITSEPKLLILQGDVEISEKAESTISTIITIPSDIKISEEPISLADTNLNVSYQTCYQVIIGSDDYTENIIGELSISKLDNSIVSFDIDLMSQRDLMDFIDQNIVVTLIATDENGDLTSVSPIVIGKITGVVKDIKTGIYNISCFDYGGIHNTVGEFISKEITPILTGSILIETSGTIDTGHKPILSVRVQVDDPDDPIKDGTDYFVNPLAGTITVPETSRLVGNATMFDYDYPDNFDTLSDLMDSIANEKDWLLDKSEVTISEYTSKDKHPIITLSDESIIDIIRKFSELSAAKIDTSLFPNMRMYSELNNFFKAPVRSFSYEDDMLDGTLELGINVDGYINKQIVTSGNKVFPNAELGEEEVLLQTTNVIPFEIIDTVNYGGIGRPAKGDAQVEAEQIFYTLAPKTVLTLTIDDPSITNSFIEDVGNWFRIEPVFATQQWALITTDNYLTFDGLTGFRPIVNTDWKKTILEGAIKFELTSQPVMMDAGGWFTIGYEGCVSVATIKGQPVSYNQGTLDNNVEVTACRPATGKNDIYGDTYENAYIETVEHASNIANSILLTKGNVYGSNFIIPLHKANNLRIGDKIDVYVANVRQHSGIIKALDYNINLDNAESTVTITTGGIK
jgi:hypothetical protein